MRFTIKFDIKKQTYYDANRERINAAARAAYRKNPKKTIARVRVWQNANSKKVRATRDAYTE